MRRLSLSLFGRFQADLDGIPLTAFRTLKVQALLIYLCAKPQTAQHREHLMTLLWPGMPETSARSNLRQVLFHLRQVLHDHVAGGESIPLLIANRHTIQLNPQATVVVDIAQFDHLLSEIRKHQHLDLLGCQTCYETLTRAAALYSGDFLTEFYLDDSNLFEVWTETTRQLYRRRMLDTLETLASMALRRQNYSAATGYAEQQVAIDELHEPAYRQLLTSLALSGQRGEALARYESFRRLLWEELGMSPASRTTELYEQIRSGAVHFEQTPLPGARGYELLEKIGEGAYGVVHRAFQQATGREVAIKIIHPDFANDPAFIRCFELEAQIIARLEHPHIVPIYDYWRESGAAYLVMRMLRAGNLLEALAGGPWSPQRAESLLAQLSSALHAAHRHGIVHGDIKPANILFDEDGNAYLADFGIAADLMLSRQLSVPESVDYISPERLQAGPMTAASDIYSLGAVLYELLTGEKPFGNTPLALTLQKQLTEPFPRVIDSVPNMPPSLDSVIQRATAREPRDRFPTALSLSSAFREALDGRESAATVSLPIGGGNSVANPYKGLRAYQEADAPDFFGREDLVNRLLRRIGTESFLAIIGPSGSGKSSLVKAGLIPALRQGALPGSEEWYIAQMTPGAYPFEELELSLLPLAVNPPASLLEPMQKDSRGLLRTIRRIFPEGDEARLLLFIDQFEELFTMVDDAARRAQFLDALLAALAAPRSPLRVVVTLRADFYDRPLQVQPLAALFQEHVELVLPLTRDELIWAIQEPSRRAGVILEEQLLASILTDVEAQPGALPLLQYALTELYEARSNGRMTLDAYNANGGVPGSLARRADELYDALDPLQQALARQVFLRLVTLGEGVEDTRRRVPLSSLRPLGEQVDALIARFGAARLLSFDHDPLTREPTVEVAHEALLRRWTRLHMWLQQSRDDVRRQRELSIAASEWNASGKDDGYLLRGARLTQFAAWWTQTSVALLSQEHSFLEASLAARLRREEAEMAHQRQALEAAQQLAASQRRRAEEQSAAAKRLARRALYLSGALIAAAILAIAALLAWQQAQRSAATSRSLALSAGSQAALVTNNTDLALTLALAANDMAQPPAFSRRILYDVALVPGTALQIPAGGGWRWSLDISPDRRLAAAGADDGSATLWDLQSGEAVLHLTGQHADAIGDVAFTPDGQYLLTSAYDDKLVLWNLADGSVVWRATNPSGDPNTLAISPDGALAASGTEYDGLITLWDLSNGRQVGTLAGHDRDWQVFPVTFSQDGTLLASGGEGGDAIIWDVASRSPLQHMQVIDDVIFAAALNPDATLLAVAGKSNSIWLFEVASGRLVDELSGLPDWVFDLKFSPDGSELVAASRDGAVAVWDVANRQRVNVLYGEDGWPLSLAFIGESMLLAGYNTGGLRVWDLVDHRRQQAFTTGAATYRVARNADGKLMAAGLHEAVRLYDGTSGEMLREWAVAANGNTAGDLGHVTAVALDAAGVTLAAGTGNGTLLLWDVASGALIGQLAGHTAYIHSAYIHWVTFSPDGKWLLSVSDDKQAILWDVDAMNVHFVYTSPTDAITAAAFSPDGAQFAIGVGTTRYVAIPDATLQDAGIYIWESATGDAVGRLDGHTAPVTAVTFSPDGRRLLSGSLDSTVRLWDLTGERQLRRFDGHTGGIMSVAFSPDGAFAASGAQDGDVIIWEVGSGALLRQIDAHSSVVHSIGFDASNAVVWSAAEDGSLSLWRTMVDDEALRTWISTHRFVAPLTCLQRQQYGLARDCVADE